MAYFESRLRSLAQYVERAYPGLKVDVNAELAYYNSIRDRVLSMVGDTVYVTNDALRSGKKILVEGANATSKFLVCVCVYACVCGGLWDFSVYGFMHVVIR